MGLRPTEYDEKPPLCHPRVGGGPGLDSRFRGNDGEGRFSRERRHALWRRAESRSAPRPGLRRAKSRYVEALRRLIVLGHALKTRRLPMS